MNTKTLEQSLLSPGEDSSDRSPVAHGYTFAEWLTDAGRTDSTSEYDLRAAWQAGEDPADYMLGG